LASKILFPAEGAGLFSQAYSDVRTCDFHCSYLKGNKIGKSEETKKIEYAHHF